MSDGNRYLLVVVHGASTFLFGYLLASTGLLAVSPKLMELMLTVGVPLSIRSDGGGEFTTQVVGHLCRWLNMALNHGPADFVRSQGAAERMGGWLQEVLSTAVGPICASRLLNPAGDTRPAVTILRDTLPCHSCSASTRARRSTR